jgi:protein-disulfide isomerase
MLVLTAQFAIAQEKPAVPPASPDGADRVEIILYSDFQCPYCQQFSGPFRELQTKGIDGIATKVEFKNFPLSIHSNAQVAHQAAMAAREQGKFWEMHDLLFANQQAVKQDDLLGYAKKLGLNVERFRKDMESDKVKKEIAADVAEGEKRGVNGTPTFFVNGKAYSGTRPFDQLKKLITDDRWRAQALAEITDNLMSKGPVDAPVTLELFVDLESPVSQPAMKAVNDLMQRYPAAVRLQFRNFPLAFHPQAPLAHEAAMTAARAGHFWEFATYILDHQDSLREQDLIAYAGKLGLDETSFAETIQQHRYAPRVDADLQAGLQRGIRGSPVVFVNAKRIDGVPSRQTLTEYVESELATRKTNPAK